MVSAQEKLVEDLKKKIRPVIFDTHREIMMNTPVDTGRLRQSIVVEETKGGFIIGTNVSYAEYVELGTRPHIIRPVNKQALKFKIGGKTIFAKSVNHPGTQGHHMFLKGVSYFESQMNNLD